MVSACSNTVKFYFLNQVCDILDTGHLLCILGHYIVFVRFSKYYAHRLHGKKIFEVIEITVGS